MKFDPACARAVTFLASAEFADRVAEEDPAMAAQIPLLQRMNALGYLTHESQSGKPKPLAPSAKRAIWERAFVVGFMKQATAAKFIRDMGVLTDKVAVYIPVIDCWDSKTVAARIPSSLDVPVTATVELERKRDFQFQVDTHLSPVVPLTVDVANRKYVRLDASAKDVVQVCCWDPKWNRLSSGKDGLFTDVVRILERGQK